nr:peptidase inhibitor 16 [Hymenolepis microstoma]
MLKVLILLLNFYTLFARKANPQEVTQILDSHNQARSDVSPPATNMMEMRYSSEMEKLAESWASRCKFAHPSWNDVMYENTGQNIAITFGHQNVDFPHVIDLWHKEKDYYYDGDYCTPGQACGHYTQMVWSSSTNVGCAVERCDQYFGGHPQPTYLYVCQYQAPGNYIGQKPYIAGPSCQDCPSGTSCMDKLCHQGY